MSSASLVSPTSQSFVVSCNVKVIITEVQSCACYYYYITSDPWARSRPESAVPLDIGQQYMRLSGRPPDPVTVVYYDLLADAVTTRIKTSQCSSFSDSIALRKR
jgi:hypothetical protein